MSKSLISFLFLIILLLSACSSLQAVSPSSTPSPSPTASSTPTEQATSSPTVAVSESTLTVGSDETPTPERVVIDLSEATLEHQIPPECVDQFPIISENGLITFCVVFDNWIKGPVDLNDGYEIMLAVEAWYEQDGKQIPVFLPLVTGNRDKNEMQVNGTLVRSFAEFFYNGGEKFWESQLHFHPGDTLWVTLGMPTEDLASNSTQGFGFEAVQFTQEDLDEYFLTGDPSILGNLIWPAIDIDGRSQ